MSEKLNFYRNPVISIVGRENVGKSTLFNKIVGRRLSIVHDSCGVTRDRICADFTWNDRNFTLMDTGGLEFGSDDLVKSMVEDQVKFAIDLSDLILFVVNAKAGLVNLDKEISILLKKSGKSVIVCVNKCDKPGDKISSNEFYSLGFSDVLAVSSVHGHGTGDLLDLICAKIPKKSKIDSPKCVKLSVLGKPNVGKSSIVNKLCGQKRSIVADFSGTTRDSIDTFFEHNGKNYLIIDTAGIRKKSAVKSDIEKYSYFRALDSAEKSDVCLVVIDASEGVASQDVKIAGISKNYYKSCILLINKWDKLESDSENVISFEKKIKNNFKFLTYALVLYVSAKTGRNLDKIMPAVDKVYKSFTSRISTGVLNSFLRDLILRTPPPSINGKQLRIYYMTQSGICPPTFVFFVNKSRLFHFSYQRHIENKLREMFDFSGSPIKFVIRQKGDLEDSGIEKS